MPRWLTVVGIVGIVIAVPVSPDQVSCRCPVESDEPVVPGRSGSSGRVTGPIWATPRSPDEVSRPIGDVSRSPDEVSRPIGEVSRSPGQVSRPIGEVTLPP